MISNIQVDFELFERVLLAVVEANRAILSADDEASFAIVFEEYKAEVCSNHPQEVLRKMNKRDLYEFYKEKCFSCAAYKLGTIPEQDFQRIQKEEREGKLFISDVFAAFLQQLHLEARLWKKELSMAIRIITHLKYANLNREYYFQADEETLRKLFSFAVRLYICCSYRDSCQDVDVVSMVKSMRQLLRIMDFPYEILHGEIYLSEEVYAKLQMWLERRITEIGGIYFLKQLFDNEIGVKYKPALKRYLIHREVTQMGRKVDDCNIPYNYLLQIGIKHIEEKENPLLSAEGKRLKYHEIISIAKNFLNVLNLHSYNVFAEVLLNYKEIPVRLTRSMLFDTMYMPVQYRTDFMKFYMEKVYLSYVDADRSFGYTGRELIAFCEFVLGSVENVCKIYSMEELLRESGVPYASLVRILEDMSWEAKAVNEHFIKIMDETNYKLRPLVKLEGNRYFLFSPCFNSFAFCEAIYRKLESHGISKLNKEKGILVENMVKAMFSEKGFSFHCGSYIVDKATKAGYECDMVLETEKYIVFIEIKNQPLPDNFEQGADVDVLGALGCGMIHSQLQCCRHMYYLQKNGKLDLEDKEGTVYTLLHKDRRIVRVSICSQEYQFLTNKVFSSKLLQSLLYATYSAHDAEEEYKLNKLNKMRTELVKLIDHSLSTEQERKNAFHDSLFRTAQQLYCILDVSDSLEEFVEYLTESIYCQIGDGDAYCQLQSCMERKK